MREREPKRAKELVKEWEKWVKEECICRDDFHPEYNGQFCLCAGCRDIIYCVDVKCDPHGDGPVKECDPPQHP